VISAQFVAQDKDANEEKNPSSRGMSEFEYPFEGDEEASRRSVKLADRRAATHTPERTFPQDVDEMTLDSVGVGGRNPL